ncbi:MAG: WD40 repeat domain-containing protein [Cyclobacteriaceae bacterium]
MLSSNLVKKNYLTFLFIMFSLQVAQAQDYLDYQLRLEPVWSRVADALGEPGSVESAEFSPDGKYIVSGTKYDYSVIMWRTSDGTELWRKYAEQEIERVGWSADGNYVAAASEDFLVTVYNAENGEVQHELKHTQGIDGLTWSNQGSLLVTGEERVTNKDGNISGQIRVYDMPAGDEVVTIDFGNTVNELFFSSDDQYLLAVGHGAVKVYKTADWSLQQTLKPDYFTIFTSGNFSPDAKYVLAVGQGGTSRGNTYLWEWESGELVKMFNHTGKKIESINWHPSGEYIAHAGHDPYIYIYRLGDILAHGNDEIPIAHRAWASDHAEYIDFNADGSFLVSAHQNGLIKLWVWMGEDAGLNSRRHQMIKEKQEAQK